VIEIINNGESLTKCYNRGLEQAKTILWCHDDITIETKQWGSKLLKQFEKIQRLVLLVLLVLSTYQVMVDGGKTLRKCMVELNILMKVKLGYQPIVMI
jgi:hypothetical protein